MATPSKETPKDTGQPQDDSKRQQGDVKDSDPRQREFSPPLPAFEPLQPLDLPQQLSTGLEDSGTDSGSWDEDDFDEERRDFFEVERVQVQVQRRRERVDSFQLQGEVHTHLEWERRSEQHSELKRSLSIPKQLLQAETRQTLEHDEQQLAQVKQRLQQKEIQLSKMDEQFSEMKQSQSLIEAQLSEAKQALSVMDKKYSETLSLKEKQLSEMSQALERSEEQLSEMRQRMEEAEVRQTLEHDEQQLQHLAKMDKQFSEMKPTQGLKEERPSEAEQALSEELQVSKASTVTTDPKFPGICFLGTPWKERITSEGLEISWEDIGITFSIPPGAVPEHKEPLLLTVRPCLAGSFEPPDGYELTSPVWIVSPAFDFAKEVAMSLFHSACLQSDEECELMSFLSAPSSPQYEGSHPRYKFKPLRGGQFYTNKQYGTVALKHFCGISTGSKRLRSPDPGSDMEYEPKKLRTSEPVFEQQGKGSTLSESNGPSLNYSVRLYRNSPPPGPCSRAIFCITRFHPMYHMHLDRLMKTEHRILDPPSIFEPVQIAAKKVKLQLPTDSSQWTVAPDKDPIILKSQIDSIDCFRNKDGKLEPSCPPMICLLIMPRGEVSTLTHEVFRLKVVGIKDISFRITTGRKPAENSSNAAVAVSTDRILCKSDLADLIELLAPAASKWVFIGLQLMPKNPGLMNTVQADYQGQQLRCLTKVLEEWLNSTISPTVEALSRALKSRSVNEVLIANEICKTPLLGKLTPSS